MRTAETGPTYQLEVRPLWRMIPVSLGGDDYLAGHTSGSLGLVCNQDVPTAAPLR